MRRLSDQNGERGGGGGGGDPRRATPLEFRGDGITCIGIVIDDQDLDAVSRDSGAAGIASSALWRRGQSPPSPFGLASFLP